MTFATRRPPHVITTYSRYILGGPVAARSAGGGGAIAAAWSAANRALYVPMILDHTVTIDKFIVGVQNTGTANVDLGIYNYDTLARIVSTGATATPGVSGPFEINIADHTLTPGRYYFAVSFAAATNMLTYPYSIQRLQMFGLYQQNSAMPLPATATLAAIATNRVPVAGFIPKNQVG